MTIPATDTGDAILFARGKGVTINCGRSALTGRRS